MLERQKKRYKRHQRVRAKISGTAKLPRLYVFRSKKHIYAQLINDEKGKTLAVVSDLKVKTATREKQQATSNKQQEKRDKQQETRKIMISREVGRLIAKKAKDLKIEKIVFDRGGYKYHGIIKALAEGAREGGLKF